MTMQLELWHLISLLLAFFGATAGMGKVILEQIERRITERFNSHEEIELVHDALRGGVCRAWSRPTGTLSAR